MPVQEEAVTRIDPTGPPAPAVFDCPHSGTIYPPDFGAAVTLELLRGGEDRFVDDLFIDAPKHGATLIIARFARTYIDPNRNIADIDESLLDAPWQGPVERSRHTELGVGLIFKKIGPGVPIYDRLLSVQEAQSRINLYWRPYHEALDVALDEAYRSHGEVWHVNCHSMQAVGNELSPDPGAIRPDFVLGDLDGRSCAPEFTSFVGTTLEGLGYSVAVNHPYKGAELVERHGNPAERRHSLQIEINRNLYMGAGNLEKHAGFGKLRADLEALAREVCDYARSRVATPASE